MSLIQQALQLQCPWHRLLWGSVLAEGPPWCSLSTLNSPAEDSYELQWPRRLKRACQPQLTLGGGLLVSQNHRLPCPCSEWEVVEGTEPRGALAAPIGPAFLMAAWLDPRLLCTGTPRKCLQSKIRSRRLFSL